MTKLTWKKVMAWRVERHHLLERAPRDAWRDVVSDICGLHAQVMSSAEHTLWARVEDVEPDLVQSALWEERSLVKTWGMRGTLHLFRADEHGLWMASRSLFMDIIKKYWAKEYGRLGDLERLTDAVGASLEDRLLTREELAKEVAKRTKTPEYAELMMGSWGGFLKPSAYTGDLCFGPSIGQKVRFTSPRTWLGDFDQPNAEEAKAEVVRRFIARYGPSTREDVAKWWGVYPGQVRPVLEELVDELTEVDVEGTKAFALTSDVEAMSHATLTRHVRLLPGFDQYVVNSSRKISALMLGENKTRVARQAGWISAVVLVNGRIDGVWTHKKTPKKVTVTIEPFGPITAWARKGAEREAERFAAFLDRPLELEWAE